jgi:hypothetical protein
VYVWQFRNNFTRQLASESTAAQASAAANAGSPAAAKLQREGRERMLHIDCPASAQVWCLQMRSQHRMRYNTSTSLVIVQPRPVRSRKTSDGVFVVHSVCICCCCCRRRASSSCPISAAQQTPFAPLQHSSTCC